MRTTEIDQVQQRPIALDDYIRTPSIVHTYDDIIRAERLRAMVAAPGDRRPRAHRRPLCRIEGAQDALGRLLDAVTQEARSLEQTLAVADVLRYQQEHRPPTEQEEWRARVRAAYADLRVLTPSVTDEKIRAQLMEIVEELAFDGAADAPTDIRLTTREQDVLALIANGLPNRAIAEKLGIGTYTVKDHVKNLMGESSPPRPGSR